MLQVAEKPPRKILVLLFAADLVFVVVHILYMNHVSLNPLFSLEMDRGYAEIFQYIKEYWIVLLLFMLAIRTKQVIYIAWCALFMYILLDDSFEIHERLGVYLASYFEFQPWINLRARDFGELCVFILFGSALLLFIGIAYLNSDAVQRNESRHLFILLILLAFFGVVVDMLHIAIPLGQSIWGGVEDAGEMLIMSIIVWYAYYLRPEPDAP